MGSVGSKGKQCPRGCVPVPQQQQQQCYNMPVQQQIPQMPCPQPQPFYQQPPQMPCPQLQPHYQPPQQVPCPQPQYQPQPLPQVQVHQCPPGCVPEAHQVVCPPGCVPAHSKSSSRASGSLNSSGLTRTSHGSKSRPSNQSIHVE